MEFCGVQPYVIVSVLAIIIMGFEGISNLFVVVLLHVIV